MKADISVIIPAHNVEKTLALLCHQSINELQKSGKSYEVIIAEDGSADNSYAIAQQIAKENKFVKILHSKNRLGKGGALNYSLQKATGKFRIFIDADYVDVPKYLPEMINLSNSYDIVIGNRYKGNSKTSRLLLRLIASKVYILFVKLLFSLPFSDMQSGFKGMNENVVNVLKDIKSRDYFWDTEFLVKATRLGYKTYELPITWVEKKSKHSASIIKDSFKFIMSLIKLKLGLL